MNKLTQQLIQWSLVTVGLIFFHSCANVIPPTGGKRDITPPQLVDSLSFPNKVFNTNRTGGNILLVFNEKIEVVALKNKTTANPQIDTKAIKYKTKTVHWSDTSGKRYKGTAVSIDLNQSLESNTTYVLNFDGAFKDINEGKIAQTIAVAFSTGQQIDSLAVTGNVRNNYSGQMAKNILVGLYPINDTSNASNTLPKYYTTTNDAGNYTIDYLKKGTYRVVAFTDKNRNKKYNARTEQIAFTPTNIQLDSSLTIDSLFLFREDKRIPLVNRITAFDQLAYIEFNKSLEKVEIKNYNNDFLKFDAKRKKLTIYKQLVKDTTIFIKMIDSTGISSDSTISLHFNNEKIFKQKTRLSIDNQYINSNFKQIVSFSQPIFESILDSASLQATDSTYNFEEFVDLKWNLNKTKLTLTGYLPKYHDTLHLNKLKFISLLGDTISKTTKMIRTSSGSFGSALCKVDLKEPFYIIELLAENNKVVATGRNVKELKLLNYKPQEITIRILIDENNNGKYDTGDYLNRLLPEQYIYLEDKIQIKAGWDIDVMIKR